MNIKQPISSNLPHSPWQLAVIDLDAYRNILDPVNSLDADILKCLDLTISEPSKYSAFGVMDGEVVRICSTFIDHYKRDNSELELRVAIVWVPSKGRYMTIHLEALHPIVSEADAIEMGMKFGIDFEKYM